MIPARALHEPPTEKQNNQHADCNRCQNRQSRFFSRAGAFAFAARFPWQDNPEQVHRQLDVFQVRRTKFFKPRLERVADLPFHIHRDANPARAGQLFDARGDVYAVAVNVAVAMHHIANVDADFKFDAPVGRDVVISFGQRALDFDGALGRFQRAPEFDQEGVADGFDFGAVKLWEKFA